MIRSIKLLSYIIHHMKSSKILDSIIVYLNSKSELVVGDRCVRMNVKMGKSDLYHLIVYTRSISEVYTYSPIAEIEINPEGSIDPILTQDYWKDIDSALYEDLSKIYRLEPVDTGIELVEMQIFENTSRLVDALSRLVGILRFRPVSSSAKCRKSMREVRCSVGRYNDRGNIYFEVHLMDLLTSGVDRMIQLSLYELDTISTVRREYCNILKELDQMIYLELKNELLRVISEVTDIERLIITS